MPAPSPTPRRGSWRRSRAVAEGEVGAQGTDDVTETGIAVGRDSAVRTAAAAQDSPGEFAGAVGAGLLLGGAGAASSGTAASGLRAGLRAEVDPRIGPFGTTIETRAGRGVRDFLSDDRGQADLTGFGRRDIDADSGDSATQFDDLLDDDTQPIAGTDPEIDDAGSQQLDQAGFEATRRAAETRNQADLEDVARDPGTQTVDNRAGGRGVTTRESRTASRDRAPLGSGGTTGRSVGSDVTDPDLSPLESQLAADLDTPDSDLRTRADPDTDAGTVTDARARQRDAEARFDARTSGLGAGAGGLFGVGSQDTPATGATVGGLLGGFGGVGTDPDVGGDIFGDIGTDVFTGVDTDPGIDSDIDTDIDTTPGLDLGGGDVDLFDPDPSDPTRTTDTDIVDPGEDPGRDRGRDTGTDPERDRDPEVPFDGDQDTDDSTALFGVLRRDDTVDSGILSGAEAAADLFGRR